MKMELVITRIHTHSPLPDIATLLLMSLAVLRPMPHRTLRHLALWLGEEGPLGCRVHTICE